MACVHLRIIAGGFHPNPSYKVNSLQISERWMLGSPNDLTIPC